MSNNEKILAELRRLYPDAGPELNFTNPFETLIATMLSAQCTDKRVNMVTEKLFKRFTSCADMAAITPEELEPHIKEYICEDMIHPTEIGKSVLASAVSDKIREVLHD